MKKLAGAFLLILLLSSFNQTQTLKGTWLYAGDIFNGKKESAPTEYSLQRKYANAHYEAFVLEKGYAPEKYETGDYSIQTDTCLETQTWCSQPSKLVGVTLHYSYTVRNDTLILKGILPNGENVEEYWKRAKNKH
jgi:hypothetical protein